MGILLLGSQPNTFVFNVTLTANAIANASAQWKADCETARLIYANLITDPCTINATVDWASSGTGGATNALSHAGDLYSSIRTALMPKVPAAMAAAIPASIPAGFDTGIQQTTRNANLKALGINPSGNRSAFNDFTSTVAAGVPDSARVGVFLHEFSHGLGRENQSVPAALSCFSAPGTFVYNATAGGGTATYFSLDGGTTNLASFDVSATNPDHSWASIITDPFNVLYSAGTTGQTLTTLDKQILNAMGYTLSS